MITVRETAAAPAPPATAPDRPSGIPQQRGDGPLEHAVRYTEERHWDVLPGTWLEHHGGTVRCSCGSSACEAPGVHPDGPGWAERVTSSPAAARRMWEAEPRASVLLPTGRSFDVLDVPESAGCLALARLERAEIDLGPVAATPGGRMMFFVLPGGAVKAPGMLRQLGWPRGALDLRTVGGNGYVPAPPTRLGALGSVQWVRRSGQAVRWPADPEEILPSLAYACGLDHG
ncbi:bifunctional DNA primase/polymerase [Streptomyces bohaiensis]|uniref:bifunctional DNA primase/polymerase n=1 Tax=Streptomyces bohaiensis TaxID=1431344 RepID=UPI003B97DEEC